MNAFYVPTKIYTGEAAFENLKQYPIHNLCIICDPFVEKSGMVNKLLRVLDEMGVEYKILSDTLADVFAKVNISRLTLALAGENVELLAVRERDESLESYYVGLVGGGAHE